MSVNTWQGQWRGRHPAGDLHQRARKVITPSGGIVRGKFPSRKNGRMVHHEGLLELDAIYLFETSPRITRYREQPASVHYPDGAKLRRYTPDFEITLSTGEIIYVEIKPKRSLADSEVHHKFRQISSYFRQVDTAFVILTEAELRQEPRHSNLRWIYHRASRIPPTRNASINALNHHKRLFPASIKDIETPLIKHGISVYSLLMQGFLHCDLNSSISIDTQLHIVTELDHEWFRISQEYEF